MAERWLLVKDYLMGLCFESSPSLSSTFAGTLRAFHKSFYMVMEIFSSFAIRVFDVTLRRLETAARALRLFIKIHNVHLIIPRSVNLPATVVQS